LTFPVAFELGVTEALGVTLGTGNGTAGLTAEAPEMP
jgi:hypothetical protein